MLVEPTEPSRWVVKRVAGVAGPTAPEATPGPSDMRPLLPGTVYVLGDNLERAIDSRRYGPVPIASVIGRVYRCYAPAERQREL